MKRLLLILTGSAAGLAFSVVATSGQTSPLKRADCATLAVPENSDYSLAYDPESGNLEINYVDSAGNDKSATVDSRAASCKASKGVEKAIEHARDAHRDIVAGECAAFKDLLNGGQAIKKGGREPNRAAAREYVTKHCK